MSYEGTVCNCGEKKNAGTMLCIGCELDFAQHPSMLAMNDKSKDVDHRRHAAQTLRNRSLPFGGRSLRSGVRSLMSSQHVSTYLPRRGVPLLRPAGLFLWKNTPWISSTTPISRKSRRLRSAIISRSVLGILRKPTSSAASATRS